MRDERIRFRSERAATVARWFGLDTQEVPGKREDATSIIAPTPGTITLICGPSGAGKTTLLRAMRDRAGAGRRWIDLAELDLAETPVVDCFGDWPLRDVLMLLARVGLGEAWSYLRLPSELSEGQRWRLKMALALHAAANIESAAIIACDEFAAVLDRISAMVTARCLRRAIDANPRLSAVVATAHDDLAPALCPDAVAWCDFGRVEWKRS